jgi:hypothetical protein
MNRRTKRNLSLLGAVGLLTLMWPGPASAETSLGGYSGLAQAEPVRIQVYEPVIPIPTTPQIDGGFAYTKSTTDTGPVSRATASYFWPGDTIGDGFGQLTGDQSQTYPIQVNSRFPATAEAPATNTAQLTTGNGMTTSSDESATKATVTGLGIAGPDTDLLGGLADGLGQLTGATTTPPKIPDLPVPVSKTLAGLATIQNFKSTSDVVVGKSSVTSTAEAYMSKIDLLGGLVSLDGIDVTSKTVSDGTKATATGKAEFGGIKIAGQALSLDQDGFELAGTNVKLPAVPDAVNKLLAMLGIQITYLQTAHSVDAATGSFTSTALQITVDTAPLKSLLHVDDLIGPLQQLVQQIPGLGDTLAPVLGIGPKIVLYVGNVQTSATAAPAYTGGSVPIAPSGGGSSPTTSSGGGSTGGDIGTGGSTGDGTTGDGTTGTTPVGATNGGGPTTSAIQPAAYNLPRLGAVPRMLILGGLLLAGVLGWLLRTGGGFLLGSSRNCSYGLPTGVPDLRKG